MRRRNLADGAPVVVYGFSAGVGPATLAALDPTSEPVPGCEADDSPAPITGAVFGDGEYFLHSPLFDGAFVADPGAMQAVVAGIVDPKLWPSDMTTRFSIWIADEGTAPRAFDDPWTRPGGWRNETLTDRFVTTSIASANSTMGSSASSTRAS